MFNRKCSTSSIRVHVPLVMVVLWRVFQESPGWSDELMMVLLHGDGVD